VKPTTTSKTPDYKTDRPTDVHSVYGAVGCTVEKHPSPPFFTTSVHMSLQLRLRDTSLPRLFNRLLADSFR